MELNLRKARKLEAKIYSYVDKMDVKSTAKIRVKAGAADRHKVLMDASSEFRNTVLFQKELIEARFEIRKQIAEVNHTDGINELINMRERLQAVLGKLPTGNEAIDLDEINDRVLSKQVILEKGTDTYGENITITVHVASSDDLKTFQAESDTIKRTLEDIEDELSKKNLIGKITLSDYKVELLKRAGLV